MTQVPVPILSIRIKRNDGDLMVNNRHRLTGQPTLPRRSECDLTGNKPGQAENKTEVIGSRRIETEVTSSRRIETEVIASKRAPTANDSPICDADLTRIRGTTEMGPDEIHDAIWRIQWRDIVSNSSCLHAQLSAEKM